MIATKEKPGHSEFVTATTVIVEPNEPNSVTVRDSIISVFPERPADATPAQTLRLIEQSGVLDFWAEEGEDGYTHDDGEPI